MDNLLNFIRDNYNFNVNKIQQNNDHFYSFYIDYNKYYLYQVNRNPKEIETIFNILKNIISHFNLIIPSKKGDLICKYDNKNLVLVSIINPENNEITINDILKNQILIKKIPQNIVRSDWGMLWGSKINYIEYQVSEFAINHKIILKTIHYYLGMAENAIQYFNRLDRNNINLYISKKRVFSPNYSSDYFNPLDIVVDYRVRDIAEYIKYAFFNNNLNIQELKNIFNSLNFSSIEYNLLICRLLFPSYYFDRLEKILENKIPEERILEYVKLSAKYENFLKEIIDICNKKTMIIDISWLCK